MSIFSIHLFSLIFRFPLFREELTKLRQEESHYLHQVESGKRQLDSLIQNLKIVQNDTNLVSAHLIHTLYDLPYLVFKCL